MGMRTFPLKEVVIPHLAVMADHRMQPIYHDYLKEPTPHPYGPLSGL
jgi:hypothetical protein